MDVYILDDDSLKNKILQSELNINFEEIEKKYKINNKSTFNKDASINIIITDILNAKSLFINEILEQKMKEYKVMLCVYRVTRVFFLFRKKPALRFTRKRIFI